MLEGAYSSFKSLAEQKGVALSLVIEPEAKGRYQGDPTRLRQIAHNLVSNALKFTADGTVTLASSLSENGLIVAVSDSGIGIAPETADRLFEKSVQADSTTTRKFAGYGSGPLHLPRTLHADGGDHRRFQRLGRRVDLYGRAALGAYWPEIAAIVDESTALPVAEAYDRDIRILAAEDNPTNQLVLSTILGQAALKATLVDNGRKAVDAWEGREWDVILMDVQMPEMDGITAAKMIRAREIETGRRRTPIVALTANALTHQVDSYLADGLDDYIAKPIVISALFAALENALALGDEEPPTANVDASA